MVFNRWPDVVVPKTTLHDYVFNCIRQHGGGNKMIDNTTKTSITHKEIMDQSIKLGCGLRKHGLRKGDIVGVVSETCPQYAIICLGVLTAGGIPTPCNPLYTTDYPLDVVFDPDEDPAFIPYSSGTTGLPKGVVLTHANLVAVICLFKATMPMHPDDAMYNVAPCFHIFGFGMQFINLCEGSTLVTDARFDLKEMLESIQKYSISYLSLVPPLMVALAKAPIVLQYNTLSVKQIFCAAAPLAPALAEEVVGRLKNAHVFQAWGLTECTPLTAGDKVSTPVDSVGSIVPNTRIKIIDIETGKELPPNEDGELCAKGPQIMKGYFKNPEATQHTIDADGWFHTGDIGHINEHGHFFIVDRLKELIKYKGFQVAPAELEAVLLRHSKIADAAVIGIPDLSAGELPKAFVVRKDSTISEKDVQKYVESHVAKYKFLRGGVSFVDAIPKSASGKILRRELRKSSHNGKAKL